MRADQMRKPHATLEQQFETCRRELTEAQKYLTEAQEQQAATSELLRVIASSLTDLQLVLDAVAETAARICSANDAMVRRVDGNVLRLAAQYGNVPSLDASASIPVDRGSGAGRAVVDRQTIHIRDMDVEHEFPVSHALAQRFGYRTVLATPLLREGVAIGAIVIRRLDVRPFTDSQIKLLETFASQAVIAIESARLFEAAQARTRELSQALEQQTATSQVLQVISSSPGELQPVFDAMLANAVRLCAASFGNLYLRDGEFFRLVALHNTPPSFVAQRRGQPYRPGPNAPPSRMLRTRGVVHVADLTVDPSCVEGDPGVVSFVELAGTRTVLLVPMLKDGEPIGYLSIYRREVHPFDDRQIELLVSFAAQAVIAIENARLLNELRQRTDDLSESLQQQTATADVLKVISSSPGNLEPVFQAILSSATQMCQAGFGTLNFFEDGAFRSVALHNPPPEFKTRLGEIIHPHPHSGLAHVARTKQIAHIEDIKTQKPYLEGDAAVVKLADHAGARTLLIVPMLKEGDLVGAISIYRQEVRPFSAKQIELVQNFAAQAVIAIENTRLLNELRESLEQQTATSEVLKVISSSQGELEAVFQTLLTNATRICEAAFGSMLQAEGDMFRRVALHNAPQAFAEFHNRAPLVDPRKTSDLRRVVETKQLIQVADAATEYPDGPIAKYAGGRTLLLVPMLKDDELIGVIGIYRQEVRPFSDKQIELVQNFAAQAVIAIENARLLNELRESLEQQTATSDVLKVISSSPGELQPVFDAMVASATQICGAEFGLLYRSEGDEFRTVALYGVPPKFAEERRSNPMLRPSPGTALGRVVATGQFVQIPDVSAEPAYQNDPLRRKSFLQLAGAKTVLCVPMLNKGAVVGAISIYRQDVRQFTDKQIELLKNFAAQAVIAIENTRLLSELRESLEQQTATSEVLKVISSSPGTLEPVFDAMLENAIRICQAQFGNLFLREGEYEFRAVAVHGESGYADWSRKEPLINLRERLRTPLDRVRTTRTVLHVHDLRVDESYGTDTRVTALVDTAGARTVIAVPMLKDKELIGILIIYRTDVRPFSGKQIELLNSFAAQAVIAIENTRLLSELRESLQQQTATADVLKVISSSPGDLEPVFEAILANA
ncbi:MAG TPA: GAF domain-containing protein, partial [Xanthobacteraceae bacterium]